MEKDIVPELLAKIKKEFADTVEKTPALRRLSETIASGKATYGEVNEYADIMGKQLSYILKKYITADTLPDGRMYYNIAERIFGETLRNNHNLIADTAEVVQNSMNKRAGIGVKAVRPPVDEDKIKGFVERASKEENFSAIEWLVGEPVVVFSRSVADDAVRVNADLHNKLGLKPKIVRIAAPKCCDWCSKLGGVYDYESVKATGNDVWRRHDNCECTLEYIPGKGKKEVVW